MDDTSFLNENHLSQYNRAKNPMVSFQSNGKVDISNDLQDSNKIGLSTYGMAWLFKKWLINTGKHHISQSEKEELIKLLSR
ncbi:hypothetical protein [Metabacillus fastidiosus]|uniref:hypothetical protein n=1 Tax=Metabacillus fastidiosus TaxID=1458 RepID=UPI003D2BF649